MRACFLLFGWVASRETKGKAAIWKGRSFDSPLSTLITECQNMMRGSNACFEPVKAKSDRGWVRGVHMRKLSQNVRT